MNRIQENKHRILVIDDSSSVLFLMKEIFCDETKLDIRCCSSGIEALKIIQQFKPDLVYLDVNMPLLDGWEVCQRIRANTELTQPIITMLSSLGLSELQSKGERVGADYFISKPASPQTVINHTYQCLTYR